MNKRWPIALGLAAVFAVVAYGLWRQRLVPRFITGEEIDVKVVAAKKVSLPAAIQAVGQLQAIKEMDIASALPGVVKGIRKVGDAVKTGEVVALIESRPLTERLRKNETAVKTAATNLDEVKARLEEIEKKLTAVREAYAKELIARRDLEVMEAAAETARAENERAQAQLAQNEAALAQARYLLALTRVAAPASGIVTRRFAETGAPVPPSMSLLSIADTSLMRVAIKLPATEAEFVNRGSNATVTAPALPRKVFTGSVTQIAMAGETQADKRPTVEIEVRNADGALKPGMEALVSVPVERKREQIVIPHAALFELQGKPYVYVILDQKAQLRSITIGAQESGDVVVISNLAEGEKVVVQGQSKLRNGRYVHIIE